MIRWEATFYLNISFMRKDSYQYNLYVIKSEKKRWYVIYYENKIWSDVEKYYNMRKQEYKNVLKMLKKCCKYFYKIHFILEFNANILIAQLNWSVNDLLKIFMTDWIAWIQFFDFIVKHVFTNKHTATDELSCQSKIKNEDEKKKNIDDFIDSQLNIVRISNLELDKLKSEILESEYSLKHQQIAYYLTSLQKSTDISQSDFRKFCKKTV